MFFGKNTFGEKYETLDAVKATPTIIYKEKNDERSCC